MDELINTFCGNQNKYREILIWLRDFDYNKRISSKSCIIVSGATCIGKTYTINSICNFLNYEITTIDNNNCYNSAQMKDIIYKVTSSSLIQILTNNIRNKVIIIDNFDCIFIGDKTINICLLKILNEAKMKNIPIICIANIDIIKKIGEIKKICKIYNLQKPNYEDIKLLLTQKKVKNISYLYKISNGNLDKIFNDINNNNNNLYEHNVEDYTDINALYNNKFERYNVEKIISKDSWMIPLKFHENLINDLDNRIGSYKKKNEYYKEFIEIMCEYDYNMFKNNTEICINIFASYVYYLSQFNYKKGSVSNIGNFTKILSYLSLQKKNIKSIYYSSNFPYYQISNYHINLSNRKFISFN
tara:strand:+ start:16209 stop:17282 length:1074 start_codon:yes stop_codon:yes gene_type:complete